MVADCRPDPRGIVRAPDGEDGAIIPAMDTRVTSGLPWARIESVFLDLDGTLLDLHFDNHFWLEHVPMCWARERGVGFHEAREALLQKMRRVEGTLQWYCVDYWSRELGLDIPGLKREVEHLIRVLPDVHAFLDRTREAGKRLVLVTNAHGKVVSLKSGRTGIDRHFDNVVTSHDFGFPKESRRFWESLRGVESFDPDRTLLVDDSLPVLRSAREFGIRHVVAARRPDSRQPAREVTDFPAIDSFAELMP